MLFPRRPEPEAIDEIRRSMQDAEVNHGSPGLSDGDAPRGFMLDHTRQRLGNGEGPYLSALVAPLDFLARLAAIIPRPGVNLVRYHGVLAPTPPGDRPSSPSAAGPSGADGARDREAAAGSAGPSS